MSFYSAIVESLVYSLLPVGVPWEDPLLEPELLPQKYLSHTYYRDLEEGDLVFWQMVGYRDRLPSVYVLGEIEYQMYGELELYPFAWNFYLLGGTGPRSWRFSTTEPGPQHEHASVGDARDYSWIVVRNGHTMWNVEARVA